MDDINETQNILKELPNFEHSKVIAKHRSSYWRTMGNGISMIGGYNDIKATYEITQLGKEIFNL
jgi:hypothetical protein